MLVNERCDIWVFFFQAEEGIRDRLVTGVRTCALPISGASLKLDLSGVEPLANGYHYEGWAIIGSRSNGPTATNEESAIMQLNKNLALAAAVAVSVVLAAACGSSESAATTVPTATQAPPEIGRASCRERV